MVLVMAMFRGVVTRPPFLRPLLVVLSALCTALLRLNSSIIAKPLVMILPLSLLVLYPNLWLEASHCMGFSSVRIFRFLSGVMAEDLDWILLDTDGSYSLPNFSRIFCSICLQFWVLTFPSCKYWFINGLAILANFS